MVEYEGNKESGYDQKAFLQIRLHEALRNYDKASLFPLEKDMATGLYGYQIMSSSLITIYNTIKAKLTKEERDDALLYRNFLVSLTSQPIFFTDTQGKKVMWNGRWTLLNDHMFYFRGLLEDYMDKHGFNPSKSDVGKAVLKF